MIAPWSMVEAGGPAQADSVGSTTAVAQAATTTLPVSSARPDGAITLRTMRYPRPPSSSAWYSIYERDGKVICTRLAVCDKFDHCEIRFVDGALHDKEDDLWGGPYETTPAVRLAPAALARHTCLVRFQLDRSAYQGR